MSEERGTSNGPSTEELTDADARIRELEATVQSLTVDLVDAKERISTLEAQLRGEGTEGEDGTPIEEWVPAFGDAGKAEVGDLLSSSTTDEGATDGSSGDGDVDEIIVA